MATNYEGSTDGKAISEDVAINTAIVSQEPTVPQEIPFEVDDGVKETSITEQFGDLKFVTERWYKVSNLNWSSTDAEYKFIDKNGIKYPNEILNLDSAFRSFLNYFAYASCKLCFKVVVNATKFQVGAIACCYAARDGANSNDWVNDKEWRNVRAVPHTIINIQNSTEGSFTVAYNNKTPLFDKANNAERGRIFFLPWSKLNAALGGSTTVNVGLFVKVEDLKVYGMSRKKGPFTLDMYRASRERFRERILRMEREGKDVAILYDLLDKVSAEIASADAFEKVNISTQFINKANIAEIDNVRVSLAFDDQMIDTGDSTVGQIPMTFKELMKIPVPVADFDWAVTATLDSVLWSTPIGPKHFPNSTFTEIPATTTWGKRSVLNYSESYVDHIAKFGHYWRGNLKFTFEFFNAYLMKGRVQIGYLYGETSYTAEKTANFVTHDVGEKDKLELIVPYNSWRDWMQVPSAIVQMQDHHSKAEKWNPVYDKSCTTGVLGVTVLNKLQSNNTMPSTIRVKVSVSCEDLEVVWPRFDSRYLYMDKEMCVHRALGLGFALNSSAPQSYYPQMPPFLKGDVPHLGVTLEDYPQGEWEAESFMGSFSSQMLDTTGGATVPIAGPMSSSYISNQVEISSLMSRPVLAMSADIVERNALANENRALFGHDAGTDSVRCLQLTGPFAEVAPSLPRSNWWKWPWHDLICPVGMHREICKSGTYWSGTCVITVMVKANETSISNNTKDPSNYYPAGTSGIDAKVSGALYFTYADDPILTKYDVMLNGAYMMNLEQQQMMEFEIPFYQIEQVKRLNESDMRLRVFLEFWEPCHISLDIYHSWRDFKLYYPTLMCNEQLFSGAGLANFSETKGALKPSVHNVLTINITEEEKEKPKEPGYLKAKWKETLAKHVDNMADTNDMPEGLEAEADEPPDFDKLSPDGGKLPKLRCYCEVNENCNTPVCVYCRKETIETHVGWPVCGKCKTRNFPKDESDSKPKPVEAEADLPEWTIDDPSATGWKTNTLKGEIPVLECKTFDATNVFDHFPEGEHVYTMDYGQFDLHSPELFLNYAESEWLRQQLLKSGDVETNPGPVCPCVSHDQFFPQKLRRKFHSVAILPLNEIMDCYSRSHIQFYPKDLGSVLVVTLKAHSGVELIRTTITYTGVWDKSCKQIMKRQAAKQIYEKIEENYPNLVRKLREKPCLVSAPKLAKINEIPGFEGFEAEGIWDMITGTAGSVLSGIKEVMRLIVGVLQSIVDVKDYLSSCKRHIFCFLLKLMVSIANILENPTRSVAKYVVAGLMLDLITIPGVVGAVLDTLSEKWTQLIEWLIRVTTIKVTFGADTPDLTNAEGEAGEEGESLPELNPSMLLATVFTTVSAILLGSLGVEAADHAEHADIAVKTMRNVGTVTHGMKGAAWFANAIWSATHDTLQYWMTGVTPEERASNYYKQNREHIVEWYDDVMTIHSTFRKEELMLNYTKRIRLKELYQQGIKINSSLLLAKEHTHLFSKLRTAWSIVQGWNTEVLRMEGANQTRVEPVVVYLFGKRGQGKSLAASKLASHMTKFFGDETGSYYSLPPNFKHLDQYNQQPVMTIDDIGQATNDEDWTLFCQMVSMTPWIPPMASTTDKGLPFLTPCIIATSNIQAPRPNTVHDYSAIHRRLTYKIEVVAKQEYTTAGKLDMTKAIADGSINDMSCLDLRVFEEVGDGTWRYNAGVSYFNLIADVKEELVKRQRILKTVLADEDFVGPVFEDLMAEAGDDYDFNICDHSCLYRPASHFNLNTTDPPESVKRHLLTRQCLTCLNKTCMACGIGPVADPKVVKKHLSCLSSERMRKNCKFSGSDMCIYLDYPYLSFTNTDNIAQWFQNAYWANLYEIKKRREACDNSLWTQVKGFVVKNKDFIAVVTAVAGLGLLSMLAYAGITWWAGEAYNDGEVKLKKPAKSKVVTIKAKTIKTAVEGEGNDDLAIAIQKNQFVGTLFCGDIPCMTGMYTFINQTTILSCSHTLIVPADKEPTKLRIYRSDYYTDIPFNSMSMVQAEDEGQIIDLVMIGLKTAFMGVKDISKKFIKAEDFETSDMAPGTMITKSGQNPRCIELRRLYHMGKEAYYQCKGEQFMLVKSITYRATHRGKGDSGALVLTEHGGRINQQIVGMHVAGVDNNGMAVPLNQDIIKVLMQALEEPTFAHVEPPPEFNNCQVEGDCTPYTGESVRVIGYVTPNFISRKTDYQKSPIHGEVLPVQRKPAVMRENDPQVKESHGDPINNMPKKYMGDTGCVDSEILDAATKWFAEEIATQSKADKYYILSEDQAVNGLGPDESLLQINMATSAGYPFSLEPGGGKTQFFNLQKEHEDGFKEYSMKTNLRERVRERLSLAKERRRIGGSYFQTALKNELRTLKKIITNACRTIEGCPLDYLILFREYVGGFANWITKNFGFDTSSGVGCNVDVDWTLFFSILSGNGDNIIGVDFTNWDGKIPAQLICAACTVINEYYKNEIHKLLYGDPWKTDFIPSHELYQVMLDKRRRGETLSEDDIGRIWAQYHEDCNVRDTLFHEIIFTISVVNGKLIVTSKGLPSGHPLTAILNCLIHKLLLIVTWLSVQKERNEDPDLHVFKKYIKSLTYGDDGISSVHDKVKHKFDRFSIARTSQDLGMKCTMENKDEEMTAFSSIKDTTFLKRGFLPAREDNMIVRAPIEMRTIAGLLNWTRKTAKFEDNLEQALWFAYHHGREEYDELRDRIRVAVCMMDLDIRFPTWDEQWNNHLVMFNKLTSEYRTRPLVPVATTMMARLICRQIKKVDRLKSRGLTVKDWAQDEFVLRNHTCSCGKICFCLVEEKCLDCLKVVDVPEWYYVSGDELSTVMRKNLCFAKHKKALMLRAGDVETNPGPVWEFFIAFTVTCAVDVLLDFIYHKALRDSAFWTGNSVRGEENYFTIHDNTSKLNVTGTVFLLFKVLIKTLLTELIFEVTVTGKIFILLCRLILYYFEISNIRFADVSN